MNTFIITSLLGSVLLAAPVSPTSRATPSAEIVAGKLGATLDDYLSRCDAFGFSGSVLIESNGEVIVQKGYGLAERDQRRSNTPDTLFDIGSLTKQFTATAVLRLEMDGKLSTSDTLARFFEGVPSDKAKIQVHHLLTHTSGLPRGIDGVGSEMQDRAKMIETVLAAPLSSKPGGTFAYSNVGYDLLGAIVEIAAGVSYEDYLREKCFAPAQLVTTGFRKDAQLAVELAARGYSSPWQPDLPGSTMHGETEPRHEPSLATEGWYSWGLRGAGGVITTVTDLRRWQLALDGDAILNASAKTKLFRPFRENYACGWYVLKTDRGSPWIEHGGTTGNGFDCKFTRFPEQRALLIVLGNVLGGGLPWVNSNLGKIVRGEEVPFPPAVVAFDSEKARSIEGDWESSSGARFQVSVQAEHVVLEVMNDKAFGWLLPTSPRASELQKKTETIVKALAKNDFKPLHASEDRAHPLFFFDRWWPRLEEQLGERKRLTVIGVHDDPRQGDSSLIRIDFAKGSEIMKFAWSGENLVGTTIGPPYPSRRVLQLLSDNAWTEFDLITSKTLVELRSKSAQSLELTVDGKNLVLAKLTPGR